MRLPVFLLPWVAPAAELMGDVVYFQVDNSARARERLMVLLGKVDAEAAKGLAQK
jgi:hypothetical protein